MRRAQETTTHEADHHGTRVPARTHGRSEGQGNGAVQEGRRPRRELAGAASGQMREVGDAAGEVAGNIKGAVDKSVKDQPMARSRRKGRIPISRMAKSGRPNTQLWTSRYAFPLADYDEASPASGASSALLLDASWLITRDGSRNTGSLLAFSLPRMIGAARSCFALSN